ncbi:MAG: hypothetical protein ACE5LC_08390 [Candidatus Aminicenantales bacterium]
MITTEKRKNKKQNNQRGSILIAGVIVLSAMVILVLPFLFYQSSHLHLVEKTYKSISALSLAEAGVERAIWEFNHGDISTWDGDNSLRTMTVASFQAAGGNVIGDIDISVQDPEGENPTIEATGKVLLTDSTEISKTIRVVLEKEEDPLFNFGMFGDQGVELHSNSMIDSYDSRIGFYGGDNVNWNGHVGANATYYGCIELKSNAKLYGNAVSGPGSDPNQVIVVSGNAYIYGEKEALSSEKEFNSISPPQGLPFRGSYILESNNQDTISESGEYTSFKLKSNSEVTINADVTLYVTGEFSLYSNSEFKIAEGVSVTLYLGGSFEQRSNTKINSLAKDPTKLIIFGLDSFSGEMEWKSNTEFYGGVYVPRAEVELHSNSRFYGSVVAQSVELESNARIHYDEALADLDISTGGGDYSFTVKSWREKPN